MSAVSTDDEAQLFVTKLVGELPPETQRDCKGRLLAWKSCFVQLVKLAQGLRTDIAEQSVSPQSSATRPSSDDSMESGSESGKESASEAGSADEMPADEMPERRRKRYVDFEDFIQIAQERQLLVMNAASVKLSVGRATMMLEALQEQRRLSV